MFFINLELLHFIDTVLSIFFVIFHRKLVSIYVDLLEAVTLIFLFLIQHPES